MKSNGGIKMGRSVRDVLYYRKIENLGEKDKEDLKNLIDEITMNNLGGQLQAIENILQKYGFSVRMVYRFKYEPPMIIFYENQKREEGRKNKSM